MSGQCFRLTVNLRVGSGILKAVKPVFDWLIARDVSGVWRSALGPMPYCSLVEWTTAVTL